MRIVCILLLLQAGLGVHAQFVGYSLKGGPTFATQRWDGFDQDPLVGYHFDLQIESLSDDAPRTLYAGLGYHRRGSAIRFRRFQGQDVNGNTVDLRPTTVKFIFNNAALVLGAKQTYAVGSGRGHIALALRGEYTINTDLGGEDASRRNVGLFYPDDAFVTRWLYGIDLGGGLDYSLSPSLDGLIELRISPDLSRQYFQPPIANVITPGSNNPRTLSELSINNVSIELSVGIRFVRYNGPYLDGE